MGVVFGLTSDVHADLVRALDRQGLDPQAKEKIERELSTTFRDLKKQREAEEKQRKIEEEMETRRLAEEAAEEVFFSLFLQIRIQDMLFATHLLITRAQVTFVRHTWSADRAQINTCKRRSCERQPKTRTGVFKNKISS